jgi:hypothetical protein
MQRWQGARITHPLAAEEPLGERGSLGTERSATRETNDLSELANTPTVTMRATRPEHDAPRAARAHLTQTGAVPLSHDDPELRRIREILVGPYLRDHERRLRAIERQEATGQARDQARDQETPAHTQALAHLAAELERERTERLALERALRMVADEHQTLRAELARERQTREDLMERHGRAIAELAKVLDQERAAHARMHALHAAELDTRLERERQAQAEATAMSLQREREMYATGLDARLQHERERLAQDVEARLERERRLHAEELERLRGAHETQVGTLRQLVADAERALVAMQGERDYLAGLLAELGLHLLRHAASPAAATADQAVQTLNRARAGG